MKRIDFDLLTELVNKCQTGDNAAFEELYRLYSPKIYYLCLKYLNNTTDAQDVMQEIFLSVYKNISTLKDARAFDRWLYTIAVNAAKDYLKKNSPVMFSELETADGEEYDVDIALQEQTANAEKAIEDILSDRETAAKLNEMINELPIGQRTAVIHFYFGGLTVAQIAELEGITVGAVKNRLFSARENLNKRALELEKDGYKLRAAIPFLPLAFSELVKNVEVPSSVLNAVLAGTAQGTAAAVSAAASGAAAVKTGLFASLGAKIVAAVVAVAVVAGGIVGGIMLTNQKNDEDVSDVQTSRRSNDVETPTNVNALEGYVLPEKWTVSADDEEIEVIFEWTENSVIISSPPNTLFNLKAVFSPDERSVMITYADAADGGDSIKVMFDEAGRFTSMYVSDGTEQLEMVAVTYDDNGLPLAFFENGHEEEEQPHINTQERFLSFSSSKFYYDQNGIVFKSVHPNGESTSPLLYDEHGNLSGMDGLLNVTASDMAVTHPWQLLLINLMSNTYLRGMGLAMTLYYQLCWQAVNIK